MPIVEMSVDYPTTYEETKPLARPPLAAIDPQPSHEIDLGDLINGLFHDSPGQQAAAHGFACGGHEPVPIGAVGSQSSVESSSDILPDTAAAVEPDAFAVTPPLGETHCWGAVLKDDASCCAPGFASGKAHFKNKFCSRCREGIEVPAARVRALTPEMQALYTNSLRAGFWKRASPSIGGGEVRIANNTITCDGPWLVVYRGLPPDLPWAPMPEEWVSDGVVRLSVAKGTLVPTTEMWRHASARKPSYALTNAAMPGPKRQRRANPPDRGLALASSLASSLGALGASPPQVMHMASAPLPIRSAASSGPPTPRHVVSFGAEPQSAGDPGIAPPLHTASLSTLPLTVHTALPPRPSPASSTYASTLPSPVGGSPVVRTPAESAVRPVALGAQPLPVDIGSAHAPVPLPSPAASAASAASAAAEDGRFPWRAAPPPLKMSVSAPVSPRPPPGSDDVPPLESPADLAAALSAAHERVAAVIEAALAPLTPVRCALTPEQTVHLTAQLHATRTAIRKARQLGRAVTFKTPPAEAEPPKRPMDVEGGGEAADGYASSAQGSFGSSGFVTPADEEWSLSFGSGRASTLATPESSLSDVVSEVSSVSRLSIGEKGRSRTGPATLEAARLSRADGPAGQLPPRGTPSHYSDRIRTISRGGSDSRLASQPARLRTLRASLERLFIAPVFGRRQGSRNDGK